MPTTSGRDRRGERGGVFLAHIRSALMMLAILVTTAHSARSVPAAVDSLPETFVIPALGEFRRHREATQLPVYSTDAPVYTVNVSVPLDAFNSSDQRDIHGGFIVSLGSDTVRNLETGVFKLGGDAIVVPPPVSGVAMQCDTGAWLAAQLRNIFVPSDAILARHPTSAMDIVMFDPRGTHTACGMSCARATHMYRRDDTSTEGAYSAAASAYERACRSEIETDMEQALAQSDTCIVGSSDPPTVQRAVAMDYLGPRYMAQDAKRFIELAGYTSVGIHGIGGLGTAVAQELAARLGTDKVFYMFLDTPSDPLQSAPARVRAHLNARKQLLEYYADVCAASTDCAADVCHDTAVSAATASRATVRDMALELFTGAINATAGFPRAVKIATLGSGVYTTYMLTRSDVESVLADGIASTRNINIGPTVAALVAAGKLGDYRYFAQYAARKWAPEDPETRALPENITAYPSLMRVPSALVEGRSQIPRVKDSQLPPFTAGDRARMFWHDLDVHTDVAGAFGLSAAGQADGAAAAFGDPRYPVYTDADQNASYLGRPGGHGDNHTYPITIIASVPESKGADAKTLYDAYAARGPTHLVFFEGLNEMPSASGFFAEFVTYSRMEFNYYVAMLYAGLAPSGTLPYDIPEGYVFRPEHAMPRYIRAVAHAAGGAEVGVVHAVLNSFEFANFNTLAPMDWAHDGTYLCTGGGLAVWKIASELGPDYLPLVFPVTVKLDGCTERGVRVDNACYVYTVNAVDLSAAIEPCQ